MDIEVARNLAHALKSLESARVELENAPDEQLAEKASAYQTARETAGPIFLAAQQAHEADTAAEDAPAAPPADASPGVPLVQPPGVEVTSKTIAAYGETADYVAKDQPTGVAVKATVFAFDRGTAIGTGTSQGTVAIGQASRVIMIGDTLGPVPNDIFNQTYELKPEGAEAPVQGEFSEPPAPAEPAQEAPAEGS